MAPIFFSKRMPFTTFCNEISSVKSFVVASSYYYDRYLIYPVVYNKEDLYYRIVDTMTDYSSYLIKGLYAQKILTDSLDTLYYYVIFIDTSSFYFSKNLTYVVFYALNKLVLTKKEFTKSEYYEMYKKWEKNNFSVTIVAENPNNSANVSFILNIAGPASDGSDYNDKIEDWVIAVIVVAMCLILAVTTNLFISLFFKTQSY